MVKINVENDILRTNTLTPHGVVKALLMAIPHRQDLLEDLADELRSAAQDLDAHSRENASVWVAAISDHIYDNLEG